MIKSTYFSIFYFITFILAHGPYSASAQSSLNETESQINISADEILKSTSMVKIFQKIYDKDAPQIQVPISAIIDLRTPSIDPKLLGPIYSAMESFNAIFANPETAIFAIETTLYSYERKFLAASVSSVLSLAVIHHNQGNYLNSIKYNNWYSGNHHQLFYMLADNYVQIGDYKNAYRSYVRAKELYEDYLLFGPDINDEMGIQNYKYLVSNLNKLFDRIGENELPSNNINIVIPDPTDEFWLVTSKPSFPRAALRKGRTGYAIMKYDVNGKGVPINIEVIERSNSLFIKPANSFMSRMVYIQYSQNDEEIIAKGITYRIDFEFDK
jgi:tetratricopeptide (TPR) repeat protein